jgi:hypothetical protein
MRKLRPRTGQINFDLRSQRNRVRYLYETVPGIEDNPMLLNVLYWTIFQGIDIPQEVQKELIERAADPQVLGKELRWAIRMAKQAIGAEKSKLEEYHVDRHSRVRTEAEQSN